MSAFIIGFIFVMLFMLLLGVGAVLFISFDATASKNPVTPAKTATQRLYNIVRRVNTETIETVDAAGSVQRWTRSTH